MFNNNDNDLQKRLLIALLITTALTIGYISFQQFFSPKEKNSLSQNQVKTETASIKYKSSQIINSQTKTKVSGDFNLLIGSKRRNVDDLKNVVSINTAYGNVKISKIGARIVSIYVKKFKTDIISDFSKKEKIFPTEIITTNDKLTELINFSEYELKKESTKDKERYIFTLNKGNIKVVKIYEIKDDGTFSLKIKMEGLNNVGLAIINGVELNSLDSSFGHSGAIIKTDKELIKLDPDIKQEQIIRGNIIWAGEENKYFLQMLASKEGFSTTHIIPIANQTTLVLSEINSNNIDGLFFGGPKLYSLLKRIDEEYSKLWNVNLDLEDSIDFGFFGILGKPLFLIMHMINQYVHHWALTIIIITILLRIVLFPLNHKSLKAMKKMSELAPKIQQLQKKYKDDPQKLNEEMMKLYSQYGANPMSGCLPLLAQIPIFIALYNVLMVTVELKNESFLWISDLADKDPYYILPILMGLSMVAQQWITPSSDKNQKMMMYIMAGVFTFLFMNFPAGLVLYWLTNNILGIFQSFIINKQMEKDKNKA
ncbi:MAG: hypothetical protein DSY66_02735 [Persephonella sp.]|nr:MAG: hypothetical protein DSY66_02735 [Persephonella sp.]